MNDDEELLGADGYTTPIGDMWGIRAGPAELGPADSPDLQQTGVGTGARNTGRVEGLLLPTQEPHLPQQAIKSEMLDPEHTAATTARVELHHELVGLLATPTSGKPSKALGILKGFERFKGHVHVCTHDGFGALHGIIAAYDGRHESNAMQIDDTLRFAVQTDDEDVDDWQLRLEDLNATGQQQDLHLCENRLKLGLA
jgi:hypothetical protein